MEQTHPHLPTPAHTSTCTYTRGGRQRDRGCPHYTHRNVCSGLRGFYFSFIHVLHWLDVCDWHALLQSNYRDTPKPCLTARVPCQDKQLWTLRADCPRRDSQSPTPSANSHGLAPYLELIPASEASTHAGRGSHKHPPAESRMLWGLPHESHQPVQHSITILGWTPCAPQSEKLAGTSVLPTLPWLHTWPSRPLPAEHRGAPNAPALARPPHAAATWQGVDGATKVGTAGPRP